MVDDKKSPISIVIPTHNSVASLRSCLEALSQNDLDETEIWIVDDDSDDDTARFLRQFFQGWDVPASVLRLRTRMGPAGARNAGLQKASLEYVLFLDADVVLPPKSISWIRETLALYRHRPEVLGVQGVYSKEPRPGQFLTDYKNLYVRHLYDITETQSPYLHSPILCLRRDVLLDCGGFNERRRTAEDFELGTLLGSKGYRFIIDRRVEGVHLKSYTLRSILAEDYRRLEDLAGPGYLETGSEPIAEFRLKAHRLNRLLALLLPVPILVSTLLWVWWPPAGRLAALLLVLFLIANGRFIRFVWKERGTGFALRSTVLVFVEMLWAQMALVWIYCKGGFVLEGAPPV